MVRKGATGYEIGSRTTHLDLLSGLLVALDLRDKLGSLVDPIGSSFSDMIDPDGLLQQLPLLRGQVGGSRRGRLDRSLLDDRRFRWSALCWCWDSVDVGGGRGRSAGRVPLR